MELRPYQAECIETIEAQPPGAFLAQMATGLGKTVTFANIPRHGERMLILSHREELVEQPRKYFNCSYGIERAQQHSHGEEVVSASIQTLARRLSDFDPEDFRLIICDEAHHAAASTYRKIFDYFRPEKLIGFTATPNRGDKVRLDTVFSKIIFQRDLRWGVKNGYLCDIHCRRVDIGFDITAVHTRQGDYAPGELDQAICPKDVLHPMYDCRFYADHITEQYEMPMTIQGVLRAIEAVKETLEDRKLRETERYRFVASILDSGATPDGQIVMVSVFLPLIEAVRQRQVLNRNDPVLTPIFAIK